MRQVFVLLGTLLMLAAVGCGEEGPAEKAGRQIDETVEETREGAEGALERLGREVDEAVEETREAADEIQDAAGKASE